MTTTVDLNADMGEGFGPWQMGNDADLLKIVTSANIACGFHAGDWDVMARTMRAAVEQGAGLGAHPGFADLQGFGRRRMTLAHDSLANMIRYQLGAAQAMARSAGGEIRHLKLHGALANMAAEDQAVAMACYTAAFSVAPDIILLVQPGTAQQAAAQDLGCRIACEIFADRAYNGDATLLDRSLPGAVIHDPETASKRVVDMVQAGAVIAESGRHIPARIDSICLHGDTAQAISIARRCRSALEAAGIVLGQFGGTAV